MIRLAPIVEGEGEVAAVPILIRRVAEHYDPTLWVDVYAPIRRPYGTLVKRGALEKDVDGAARLLGGQGAVLVLVDCEDECPAHLGPELLARAQGARTDLPVGLVLAHREYESWFLAAAESLRGRRGLPDNLPVPADPEGPRGAKEWLSRHMPGRYSERRDQPALTALMDIQLARRADSFDKCCREITRLLDELRQQES